ncbi:MAG: 5-oxoprolinase subunit PxpB [Holophagales bacterium]|nr:5-oxoprolinase subunit PxpB [Holophagales bacterium]MBK9963379.1 5-oxoprolinase subunit PxpB [Holophagales bacterium]
MTGAGAHPSFRLVPASDTALLAVLAAEPSEDATAAVLALREALAASPPPGLVDLRPAYTSLLVVFDPRATTHEEIERLVTPLLPSAGLALVPAARTVEVPVCYEGENGPDLADVARGAGLSPGEVVAMHAGAAYRVAFVGFSPGFAYLLGLPSRLATPRLPAPRLRVPAGSVGIAGGQTGLYPRATPGGWRLVGRTPLRLFAPNRESPALLLPGDAVRFVSVSPRDFDLLARGPG